MKWVVLVACLLPYCTVAEPEKCANEQICPAGTTCCKLSLSKGAGPYGCCNKPSAVCCPDQLHCCPSGTVCDVSKGTCTGGKPSDHVLRFFSRGQEPVMEETPVEKIEPRKLKEAPSAVSNWDKSLTMAQFRAEYAECPDKATECPSTSTCCRLRSGHYGCCDGENAVCCSDGSHCCPQGYVCDEKRQACTSASRGITFSWSSKKPVRARPIARFNAGLACPDRRTVCLENDTCCNATSGYGCCPISNATCCSDRQHCCPPRTKCDVIKRRCFREEDGWEGPWMERRRPEALPVDKVRENLSREAASLTRSVMCKDGLMCEDGQTCCQMNNGSYGCCSFPDVPDTVALIDLKRLSAGEDSGLECPDGSLCRDGSTCCKMEHGRYGCCNLPEAVCCSDHRHCCPSGYRCNLREQRCMKGTQVIAWIENQPALPKRPVEENVGVVCPGGSSQCPDGSTCCELASGQYGCCPLPQAVCCSDRVHCCPSGYTCQVSSGQCQKGGYSVPWVEKQPSTQRMFSFWTKPSAEDPGTSVVCPDQSQCSADQTCCKLSDGQYGCCPLPDAVCCSDGLHCCPQGFSCQPSTGECVQEEHSVPWLEKQPAVGRSRSLENVKCPGGRVQCPSGNTCCKLPSGDYGCCPVPEAVCCSDGVHCCPSGYTCDVAGGQCKKQVSTEKQLQLGLRLTVRNVICPDEMSECPDGNTCCKLASGGYGCCPLAKAVCCGDHVHCCPEGYTCETTTGTCRKGELSIPWQEKQPAVQRRPVEENVGVECPGGTSQCPDGSTCCMLASGKYGCCPLPQAVCCSDHLHCCPEGYTCETTTGQCQKGELSIPWQEKQPAVQRTPVQENVGVMCPGGLSQCPAGSTCCMLASGQYGCCPMPQALCCSDHEHCCPEGYTCNMAAGQCQKGQLSIPWREKKPAIQRRPVEENVGVVCPGGSLQCPDGSTCCELASGQYGCCPLPQAVCCKDKTHCCPNGYTCDVSTGSCTQGSLTVPWQPKQPALQRDVVCPDGESVCTEGQTCCPLSSGAYACCGYKNALCCADKLHCCPEGYTCNDASGNCWKVQHSIPWAVKTAASPRSP